MIQAVGAPSDENGEIRVLEPLRASQSASALVSLLPSSKMEEQASARLSETSLEVD
jgi:hypothetical protein